MGVSSRAYARGAAVAPGAVIHVVLGALFAFFLARVWSSREP